MESPPRCSKCVHWESRPELDMSLGTGYCDFHEKVYSASHSCDFFTAKDSPEGRAYLNQRYPAADEEDEDDALDELEV